MGRCPLSRGAQRAGRAARRRRVRRPSGGGGFEAFYGFIGGEDSQWEPALYEGTTPVEPPATVEEGYRLIEDLADRAVGWVRQQERSFARQQELGIVPPGTDLTGRHDEIVAWDAMPEDLKPVLARQMEVYAGFLEHTDHHVRRLIDAIDELGAPPGADGLRLRRRQASARVATSRSPATAARWGPAASTRRRAMIVSADETTDIGHETGTTVSSGCTATTSRLSGRIHWVQIDLGDDHGDHVVPPEERLRVAVARQ